MARHNRRTILRLGFLLAIVTSVAIAVPTPAAGSPHWYVVGVKASEGKQYPTISWGTLSFSSSNCGLICTPSCENAVIGEVENPTGGGAGEGETDLLATTDCADVECPEEDALELQVHWEGLPRANMLVEAGTKSLFEIKDFKMVVGCYIAHTSELVAEPSTCTGSFDPEVRNGSGNLSQTGSKMVFTGEPDKLECVTKTEEGEVKTEAVFEKSLNTIAYGSPVPTKKVEPETANTSQATLEVKNP